MINTEVIWIPAYTTKEFRNFGTHEADTLYKYKFTPQDRNLLINGSIKLVPTQLCEYTVTRDIILDGKKCNNGIKIEVDKFDEKTLMTLLKTGTLKCALKEEYKNGDILKLCKVYDCLGKTFKTVSTELNIDYEVLKEKFELKQGGTNKKVSKKDIELLKELI